MKWSKPISRPPESSLTDPGKVVFFNDRLGTLMVRASLQDLEIIQEAIELLNQTPPQLTIEAKFVELSQEDSRALGFNWYLGNTLVNNGAIGFQGGTAPSYQGAGTQANPSGIFPGPGTLNPNGTYTAGPGAVAPSASDNLLTSGLRNTFTSGNTTGSIPTVATISGIMTDPQFRVAIQAIQQRTGSDLLSAPKVTTLERPSNSYFRPGPPDTSSPAPPCKRPVRPRPGWSAARAWPFRKSVITQLLTALALSSMCCPVWARMDFPSRWF